MTHVDGGFFSTQDADSEGVEGKFYVWKPDEVEKLLGPAAAKTFCYVYDVSDEGNFEGHNILNRPKTLEQCAKILGKDAAALEAELAESRAKLLAARNERVWPGLDDKVLVSWNALMLEAFALAASILHEPRYLSAASNCAELLIGRMRDERGRLLHSWRNGQARFAAYLDDYTCLTGALVTLYEQSFEERWIDEAVRLADIVLEQFADAEGGGFFYTAADHEQLIARHKDMQDSSVPSGNAMAATALLRLGKLCGRSDYLEHAQRTLRTFSALMKQHPTASGQMLIALDFYLGPTPELVLLLPGKAASAAALRDELLSPLQRHFIPNKVLAARGDSPKKPLPHLADIFAGKQVEQHQPMLYVCQNFACQAPITGRDAILAHWEDLGQAADKHSAST
jgi:uncharacterized protein YyaL (SSP411 family)